MKAFVHQGLGTKPRPAFADPTARVRETEAHKAVTAK